jgi:Uma2 family endonuclease
MATQPRRLRPEDIVDIEPPDGVSGYELVNGELVEVPFAYPEHGRLAAEIAHRIASHIEVHGPAGAVYSEAGYVLGLPHDRDRMRAPDVSFISQAMLAAHGGEPANAFFRIAPDLIVEVESRGTRKRPLQQRIEDFLAAGVKLLWVVHPATHSITVYHGDGSARLVRGDEALDGEDVLPGFSLPLPRLFGRPAAP